MIMLVLETTGDFSATIGGHGRRRHRGVRGAPLVRLFVCDLALPSARAEDPQPRGRRLDQRAPDRPDDAPRPGGDRGRPADRRTAPPVSGGQHQAGLCRRRRWPACRHRSIRRRPASDDAPRPRPSAISSARPAAFLLPGDDLRTALDRFSQAAQETLPVIDNAERPPGHRLCERSLRAAPLCPRARAPSRRPAGRCRHLQPAPPTRRSRGRQNRRGNSPHVAKINLDPRRNRCAAARGRTCPRQRLASGRPGSFRHDERQRTWRKLRFVISSRPSTRPRRCRGSISTSPTASSSSWSVPRAAARRTTLRMIAGLEECTSGEIYIGDQLVNDVPPKDRDIAMVFQNYALYPHMTVFENMSFGLRLKKFPKAEIKEPRRGRRPHPRHHRTCSTAGRSSSPAASGSGWRWAARSCATPRSFCSTSRCRTSTPSCACRCAPRSRRCTSRSRPRRST